MSVPMSRSQIAQELRALSQKMIEIGTAMDYYGGFDPAMGLHGRELIGAARTAESWAFETEEDSPPRTDDIDASETMREEQRAQRDWGLEP